jgi:predicted secreted protein
MRHLLLLLYLFITIESTKDTKSVQVYKLDSEDDANFSLNAKPNSKISLRLIGNPTTGYGWFLKNPEKLDENFLVSTNLDDRNSAPFKRDQSAQFLLGSPGYFSFEFKVKDKGNPTVEFVYKRPWEQEGVKSFKVELNINDDDD